MASFEPIAASAVESIDLLESVRLRKFQDGFMLEQLTSRQKISGKTKRRTNEIIRIDRTAPHVTVKYHLVQELNEAGQPVGDLEEHIKISPAKRRPRS